MQIIKHKADLIFFSAGFLLTLFYIVSFQPVSDVGDTDEYIRYAMAITGGGDITSFIHRSPFYPWFLATLTMIFGNSAFIEIAVIIQYLLLFFSAIMIYKILISNVFNYRVPAIWTTSFILINLSAVFYGYMVLSESLTLFFFIVSIWFLIKGVNGLSGFNFLISGLLLSAMVLTRFNTLPMVLVFSVIIILFRSVNLMAFRDMGIRNLMFFLIPVLIILNGYALLNYLERDFYGLFPTGGSFFVSRNTIIKTINGSEKVSAGNLQILKIFKDAKEKTETNGSLHKGSLIKLDKLRFMNKLYGGFSTYSIAEPELSRYFSIDPVKPEPVLSEKLAPFYKEILKINRGKVWELRLLSLLNSFRSSSGIIISQKPGTNIGMFPGWIIQVYKLGFMILSAFVFISSIVYFILLIFQRIKAQRTIVIFILIVFGFFFINFAFATAGDANRFKFPADPIIISLGVFYFYSGYSYFYRKIGFSLTLNNNVTNWPLPGAGLNNKKLLTG